MKNILNWTPDAEVIDMPDTDKSEIKQPWYKKNISIPLWGISTVILVASAAASYVKFSKRT